MGFAMGDPSSCIRWFPACQRRFRVTLGRETVLGSRIMTPVPPGSRFLAAAVAVVALAAGRPTIAAPGQTAVERANALLAQMTLDEKISLAASGDAGIPRLGVPPLVASDGPNGVRLGTPNVTAFPNAQILAASWDRALARRFGTALGAETAGKGFNLLFAPTVNILRTPKWGRAAETFGEDPYLAGQIAAAEIQGIQGEHVIAQVKHFAANNQEIGRLGNPLGVPLFSAAVNVIVSERALQEIYFPAFKAAVQEGQAASVMCSYPRINGLYACQNPSILGTLKNAWGFLGFVGPDAILAVRNTAAAINAGTDNFLLGGIGASPLQVLRQIASERLDDMVRRILTAMFSVGLFDAPNTGSPDAVVSTPEHRALSTEIAARGTVLLKNDGDVLPLTGAVHSIAVVGYDAGPATQTMEGGSAAVVGGPVVTPLAGITARAGQGVTVTHAPGTLGVVPLAIVPADVLSPSSGSGPGLFGAYYAGMNPGGSPLGAFVSPTLDFDTALPTGAHSARWTGTLTPTATGTYRFSLGHGGVARLFVDGALIASGDTEIFDGASIGLGGSPALTSQGLASLTAGVPVPITVEYSIGSSFTGSALHLGWQPPDPTLVAEAVAAASAADVALVFVNDVTGEGMDRSSLALPGDQDRLIEAVATANPRTIVVLHTAGPVLMPWLSQVAGVLQAWYPGQESGNAIAAVLFGDVEPSGRLPMTYPVGEDQGPATAPAQYPGVNGVVSYDEGIYVGYRYYDQFAQQPLFPFGYGLSYTSFSLDRLRVGRRHGGRYRVSVRVTNTGHRAGAEVVQLYVAFPASADEPPNQLRAFAKVSVAAGRRKRVRMALDRSSFATWSTADVAWVVEPGEYRLRVGTSSRDLPAEASVVLQ
jgi:beta-glucosidase